MQNLCGNRCPTDPCSSPGLPRPAGRRALTLPAGSTGSVFSGANMRQIGSGRIRGRSARPPTPNRRENVHRFLGRPRGLLGRSVRGPLSPPSQGADTHQVFLPARALCRSLWCPPPPSCWAGVKPGPRSGSPPRHSDELRNGRSSDLKSQPTRVPREPRIWAPCVPSGLRCADSRGTLVCRLVCVQFTGPSRTLRAADGRSRLFQVCSRRPRSHAQGDEASCRGRGGFAELPRSEGCLCLCFVTPGRTGSGPRRQHRGLEQQLWTYQRPRLSARGGSCHPGAKYTHITSTAGAIRKSLALSTHFWNLRLGEACV